MAEEGLRQAAKEGDISSVRKLILAGTKQTENEQGETPLFLATTSYMTEPKYVEVVRELLDNGADVNKANKAGDAPIHNTASLGNFETTELLIDYGADIDVEGEAKMVPLGLAAMKRHHAIVNLLIASLLENDKITQKQFKWMFDAVDDNQQLAIYRAISSIIHNKNLVDKLIDLSIVDAVCSGVKPTGKKGVLTHALKLLLEIVKTPKGLKSAKDKKVDVLIKETITKDDSDPVLQHLGGQLVEKLN